MKALVIGLGSMGRKRVQVLTEQKVEVFGVDFREDRRKYIENEYGIKTFDNFEKGLEVKPDFLVVCNKPNEHLQYVKFGLENNIHTFSEENCVSDFILMDDVIRLSESKKSLIAAPSCTFRYHPCVQWIKKLVGEGILGDKNKGFVTYHGGSYLPDWHTYEKVSDYYVNKKETGGGRDMIVFEYEWLQWIFGDVKSVMAATNKYSGYDADIIDTYQIISDFEGGNTASVIIDLLLRWSNRYFRFATEYGEINWDYNSHHINMYDARDGRWSIIPEAPISGPYKGWNQMDMYRDEIRHFIDAIQGKVEYCTNYRNEKRLSQITLASEESGCTGKKIDIID
jgi:Predicted dehydrogenases and related proteins